MGWSLISALFVAMLASWTDAQAGDHIGSAELVCAMIFLIGAYPETVTSVTYDHFVYDEQTNLEHRARRR